MPDEAILSRLRQASSRAVGAHQTVRAIARGAVVEAVIATDADPSVVEPVVRAAAEHGVGVARVDSMAALGRACGIAVGAAAAAVLVGDPPTGGER